MTEPAVPQPPDNQLPAMIEPPPAAQDQPQSQPPATPREITASEFDELRDKVTRLDSFKAGAMACGQIMTGIVAILLAVLGVATVTQFVNSAIDARVQERVSQEVSSQVGQLQARLGELNTFATQMADSVRRAEVAAAVAEAASPRTTFSFGEFFQVPVASYTIIIASETTLAAAKESALAAIEKGYPADIYRIGDYYTVTVGQYISKQEAENNLPEIRAELEPTAYPIDLSYACPYPSLFEDAGFYGCFLSPTPAPTPSQ